MQGNSGLSDVRPIEYLDFELEIGSGSGLQYPVAVLHSPAGETRATMTFPYSDIELENRLLALEKTLLSSGKKLRQMFPPSQQPVQVFGQALFDALLVGEVRSRYDVSVGAAREQDKGLRLKMRIQPPELAALPWEFLYDSRQREYVCLSRYTPLVRYLEVPQPISPPNVTPPLRILGMSVSPSDLEPLDLVQERRRMQKAFRKLDAKGSVMLTWLSGQTWRDLQQAMQGGPWHVFHFIGHGWFDRNANEGFIALADESGEAYHLSATALGRLLADHRSLRLALLNACEGARGGERDVFSSTAAILMRRGIPAVLAMQYPITDQAAIEFAGSFYAFLANGMPVDAAVVEARKAVTMAVKNTVEWGTPVLHMRSSDGVLFNVQGDQIDARNKDPWQKMSEVAERDKDEEREELYFAGKDCITNEQWEAAVGCLGIIADSGDEYEDVRDLYDEARKQLDLQTLRAEAEAQLKEEEWAGAAKTLAKIIGIDPACEEDKAKLDRAQAQDGLQIRYEQVVGCLAEEKWPEAIKDLEIILEQDPHYRDVAAKLEEARKQHELAELYRAAARYQRNGHWQEAIDKFVEIIRRSGTYEDMAVRLEETRRQQELAKQFSQGVNYRNQGKWEEAVEAFERVRAIDPNYPRVQVELADAQQQSTLEGLHKQGEASLLRRNWRRAAQIFKKLRRLDQRDGSISTKLGEAEERLELDGLYRKGVAHFRKGMWIKAKDILEKVVRQNPDYRDATAKFVIAQIRSRQSNPVAETLRGLLWPQAVIVGAVIVVLGAVYLLAKKDNFIIPAAPTPRPATFCNGDFERDFECWQHGGELEQSVKCEEGQCYAVLGSPDYECEDGVPEGEAWIKQSFNVLETISPTLSLRYQVFSYDILTSNLDESDFFQVSINGKSIGEFGNTEWGESDCDREVWDSGWQSVEFDLSPYRGERVELSLRNLNRVYERWNTWTYIDDVTIR